MVLQTGGAAVASTPVSSDRTFVELYVLFLQILVNYTVELLSLLLLHFVDIYICVMSASTYRNEGNFKAKRSVHVI